MNKQLEIFCCYAHEDQSYLLKLKRHLASLLRLNLIGNIWYDADISPGAEWEREINKHLNTVQVILLLVSPDFMASDYCYSKEMIQALERHERGEALVIPVIVRPVYGWQQALFGKLQALPTGAKPITVWQNRDEAFSDVAKGIHRAIEERTTKQPEPSRDEAISSDREEKASQPNLLTYGKEIAISTWNETFVGADLNEAENLFARVRRIQEWEIFEIVDALSPFSPLKKPIHYGDRVALKAKSNNHFVGAQLHSQNELAARVDWVKDWEIFTLLPPPANMSIEHDKTVEYGSPFILRADNGMFVGCRFHLDSSLAAVSPDAKEWETFVFIDPTQPMNLSSPPQFC